MRGPCNRFMRSGGSAEESSRRCTFSTIPILVAHGGNQGAGIDGWRASNAVLAGPVNAGVPHNRWSLSETGSVANPTKEALAHG
jgi:hypothetical protein